MAVSIGEIEATLRLRDELSGQLQVAVRRLGEAGGAMKDFGAAATEAGMAFLPLSAAVTAAGAAAFSFGKDYEAAMKRVETLSGVSADSVARMTGEVMELSGDVGKAPEELARGLLVVTSTGMKGAEAMEILTASSKLAAAGLGETKDIARSITSAMTAYGKENLSAAEAADKLFAAVREGGAEANEFAGSLGRVIGISATLGVSFDEVVSQIATFSRLGVDADEAVTALRGTMMNFLHPSQQAREQLEAMGTSINEVRMAIKEKGLAAAMTDLVMLTKGNDDALGAIIPNVRALAGILGTAGAQSEAYARVLKMVQNSTGDADSAFQRASKTVDFQWNQALSAAQALAIDLFNVFKAEAMSFVGALAPMINGVRDFVKGMNDWDPAVRTAAVALAALVAVAGPGLLALGVGVRAVGFAIVGLSTAAGLANTALFTLGNTVPVLTARLWLMEAAGGSVALVLSGLATVAAGLGALFVGWKIGEVTREFEVFGNTLAEWVPILWNWKLGLGEVSLENLRLAEKAGRLSAEIKKQGGGFDSAAESARRLRDQITGATLAKDMAQLDKIMQELGKSGDLSNDVMMRLGRSAKALQDQGVKLSDGLQNIVTWMNNKAAATKAANDASAKATTMTSDQVKAMKEIEELTRGLTDKQKELTVQWDALGASAEQIAKRLGLLSSSGVEKFLQDSKAAAKAFGEEFEESLERSADATNTAKDAIATGLVPWMTNLRVATGDVTLVGEQFTGVLQAIRYEAEAARFAARGGLEKIGDFITDKLATPLSAVEEVLGGVQTAWAQMATVAVRAVTTIGSRLSEGDWVGAIVAGVAAIGGALKGAFRDEEWEKVNDLRDKFLEAKGGLGAFHKELVSTLGPMGDMLARQILAAKTTEDYERAVEAATEALEEHGRKVQEVKEGIAQLGTNFAAIVGGSAQLFARISELSGAIAKARDEGKSVGDLLQQQKELAAASAGELNNLGVIALASFNAAMEAGYSFSEALAMNQEGLKQLASAFIELGVPIEDAALKTVLLQSAILDRNPQLLKAIDGLTSSTELLAKFGMLNIDTFAAMQTQGVTMYQRLQGEVAAVGGATKDALMPMQGFLHEAEEAAKELGIPLDENLQMLIDQSKELGIWRDKGKSANDILLEGIGKLVDKMNDFIDAIAKVPKEIGVQANVHWNVPNPRIPTIDVQGNIEGFARGTQGEYVDFGPGTLAVLHGKERIMTEGEASMPMALSGASAGGGGGFNMTAEEFFRAMDSRDRKLARTIRDTVQTAVRR